MGEETSAQSSRKTSLGHLRAVKQLITVASDLKRRRVHPEAFQSVQLDTSRIFDVSKQTTVRRVRVVKSQNGQDTWLNGDHSFKQ